MKSAGMQVRPYTAMTGSMRCRPVGVLQGLEQRFPTAEPERRFPAAELRRRVGQAGNGRLEIAPPAGPLSVEIG